MNKQEQNEALAKWLSERTEHECIYHCNAIRKHWNGTYWAHYARPFTESLDSMALIQGAMNKEEFRAFALALYEMSDDCLHAAEQFIELGLCATAAQRAAAACRALGLWKDSETP